MEYRVTLTDYSQELLKFMYQLQQKGTLCDVGLECKDGMVYAHKLVIMSCGSPYLRQQVLTGNTNSTRCYVNLFKFSLKTVHDLVKTLYTGILHTTGESLTEMTNLCRFLRLNNLLLGINTILNNDQETRDDTHQVIYEAEIIKSPSGTPVRVDITNTELGIVDSTCDNEDTSAFIDHEYYCGSPSKTKQSIKRPLGDEQVSVNEKRGKFVLDEKLEEISDDDENVVIDEKPDSESELFGTSSDSLLKNPDNDQNILTSKVMSQDENAKCEICSKSFVANVNDPRNIVCQSCKSRYSGDKTAKKTSEKKKYTSQGKRCHYSAEAMKDAYNAVKNGKMKIYSAALEYGVPESTLQSKVSGKYDLDCLDGSKPVLSHGQEAKLSEYFVFMGKLGYTYSREDAWRICDEFAVSVGCRERGKSLGKRWWYRFLDNFPELHEMRKKLGKFVDKKFETKSYMKAFFSNLKTSISVLDAKDEEINVFNVVSLDLSYDPPYFITETRQTDGQTITMFGCGNAGGGMMPPFYVFPHKTKNGENLKDDCFPGSCMVPREEMFASEIFLKYLQEHFSKYVSTDKPKVLIFDGHNLYISVSVMEWTKENNISIVVLPARSGEVLQPVEVDCLPCFEKYFNEECESGQIISERGLDRPTLCKAAYKAYTKAFSRENLVKAFKMTSVYPMNVSWLG